ncbi:LysM peptidoglycan-binding domain-containing protein [Aequorivita sp. SDUM287046]|uniref:LysM peptidoglycan-binding domain-containing protein n=1 Tax=Aequorivita aurantiaca TaxID=3053356 RepID=A0ABT8DFZ6_9FLAO|nr:LysM peptidoglycan-binding domain-containing protein [Aequorivita aurantiaca]MDN3723624.1 LysM peptidoglycan-binding domain-containing protein [Aequorivita aurantiaca]
MKTYTIKSGDSLGSIAFKELGSTAKWREIAALNDIVNPNNIKVGQLLQLPIESKPEASTEKADVVIIDEDPRVYYQYQSDTTKNYLGKKFKLGISRPGSQITENYIQQNPNVLTDLKISQSELNALWATSENEGNLDAVNTWDNSFMSFGMFQWTLGAGSDPGELPALIKLVKEKYPDAFEQFCGKFGVDVSEDTTSTYGYLIHNSKKVKTAADKQFFRSNMAAYRFASAGMDSRICAVQILHAINRFNLFYFNKTDKLEGNALHDLFSSEYAAALFLDNHVNRPGYLLPCVATAIKSSGLTFNQLLNGGDAEEMNVIDQYLKTRETYGSSPMTHAKNRAEVTKRYLDSDKISALKGSFKSNRFLR